MRPEPMKAQELPENPLNILNVDFIAFLLSPVFLFLY